jgi:hypothetical protein
MPISILKDIVVDHLDAIGFKRPGTYYSHSVRGCVKSVILNGSGVDIVVLDKSTFRVSIQADRYYESLVSDYYYSLLKVTRQRESLELMLKNDGPGAWMLVTAYYQAFYAAIQISRLSGLYNMSIESKQMDRLNNLNESNKRLTQKGAYLGCGTYLDDASNSIVIKFSKNGVKPHQLAWSNISGSLKNSEVARFAEGQRLLRIAFFKEIINEKPHSTWPTPSTLRNDWNYSLVDSYDRSSDIKAKKLKYILQEKKFDRAKSWCDQKKRNVGDEDFMASLGYVSIVLENVIHNISSRLLGDVNK